MVERLNQIAAFAGRNRCNVAFPVIRKEGARAGLIKPLQLELREKKNAAQDELAHARRVSLGIGERQRRAPRASKDQPSIDVQVFAQFFDISDEMPSGVVFEAGVRSAATATALIKKDDAIGCGIEE